MNRLLASAAAVLLATAVSAQATIVTGAAPSGLARCMNNNNNSVTIMPDGSIWAIVYTTDSSGGNGHLELRRSLTHGTVWVSGTYSLPNNTSHNNHHNNSGCVVAGRDGNKLHVAWADKTADPMYWSSMYQVFDTQTLQWVGTPTLLAKGYSANNNFWPVDIAVTSKGTVAVCISGHRSGGLGLGSWDCGLAVKPRGGSFNSTLLNLRQGGASYSQNASITVVDETIHCCMKNATGGYGIAYRSYNTETKAWDQSTQVAVGPNNNQGIAAGNKSVIAADTDGGLYVTYVTGSGSAKRTLRLAYAAPGKGGTNTDWSDIVVIPDTATVGQNYRGVASGTSGYPQLQGGNTTYRNYTLSPGAGGMMAIVYSKAYEDFSDLYVQTFSGGTAVLPEIKLSPANSKPYSFEWLVGARNGDMAYQSLWLSYGSTDAPAPNNGTFPNGRVDFWRLGGTSIARTVAFGTGCQGNLPQRPRIHARASQPLLGSTHTVTMDRFPANAPFFIAVGTQMSLPPLNLWFMGIPSCDLYHNFPLIANAQAPASGTLSVPWNIPNDPNLNGVVIYAQCLVVAPGSTPGGAVTTNALAVLLGN